MNVLNLDEAVHNPDDPVSGFAAVPRNMTGIATRLREASYRTHFVGKWDAGMATPDHTPHGRGYDTSLLYFHREFMNDYTIVADPHFAECALPPRVPTDTCTRLHTPPSPQMQTITGFRPRGSSATGPASWIFGPMTALLSA